MSFRSQFESLVGLRERWSDRADVYMVYVREAFPQESRWPAPVPDGRPVRDPRTLEERLENVARFTKEIGDDLDILVDGPGDELARAYDAYPFRVYAIAPDGTIAVRSEKGASGFASTLARIERWLADTPARQAAREIRESVR